MPIETFTKRPGQALVSEQGDGSVMTLHSAAPVIPEWIRLPADLGGARTTVLSSRSTPCPLAECGLPHMLHVLDAPAPGGGNIGSIECTTASKFFWVRVP